MPEGIIVSRKWLKQETDFSNHACLEMLDLVAHQISFEHADQLMQCMTTLSPRALQRLFLWCANRHNYVWFKKLDLEKIDLGSGDRVVEKSGELDKNFFVIYKGI